MGAPLNFVTTVYQINDISNLNYHEEKKNDGNITVPQKGNPR